MKRRNVLYERDYTGLTHDQFTTAGSDTSAAEILERDAARGLFAIPTEDT